MTAPVITPDATRCPDCRALLTGVQSCAACGLALTGPAAGRLWQVDVELLRLDSARGTLLVERSSLLEALRPAGRALAVEGSLQSSIPSTGSHVRASHSPTAPPPGAPFAAAPPRAEWTPQRIQNLLLALGGLLLAVAALVFAAVTYDRLGAGGRAAVLVALTLAAGTAAPRVRDRGLTATAETLGAFALVLAALDAYGLRTLGLADDTDPLSYAAVAAAVLAAVAGAYARLVPLRVVTCAAVVLTQLPVLLLLARYEAGPATAGLVLTGLAAADLAVLTVLRGRLSRDLSRLLSGCVIGTGAFGLLAALAAVEGDERAAAAALLAQALLIGGASALTSDRTLRALLSGTTVPLLALAAYVLAQPELLEVQLPLVLAAVALLAAQAAGQLPHAARPGPLTGALIVAGASALAVVEDVVTGLAVPLTWLADPWSLPSGTGAREALGPGLAWEGTVVTTVVLGAAAVTVVTAGLALHRLRAAAIPAAVLLAGTAVLLPLGLALSHPAALAVLLLLATFLAGGGSVALRAGHREVGLALAGAATAVALLAAGWSTADRETSLLVLPLAALLLAALSAVLPAGAAGATAAGAGALAAAALAAAGAANGLAADQVGGLLLVAVAALAAVAAAPTLEASRRFGVEISCCAVALAALTLVSTDVGWLSWVLAGTGVLALATALRPDRRNVAAAGGLLLAASSWVRLADAGVNAPEPYVLPLAAIALVLGHLRRRTAPDVRSWAAYGPGLTLALVPSLLASFDDASLTRPLLVGLAATVVLLAGARLRLQAPLAIGATVLAVDALALLGPYAAALPRWMSLGAAGVLLVAVGATYEQRRRDVASLRGSYDALS